MLPQSLRCASDWSVRRKYTLGVAHGVSAARAPVSGVDDARAFPAIPSRLFEGVGDLQQAQLIPVPPDDLNADR